MIPQPPAPPSHENLEDWLTWSRTKVSLSLAVTLYVKPPTSAADDGALVCYQRFLDLCEPRLTWYASAKGQYRRAEPKVLRIPFRRLHEAHANGQSWGWVAYGGEDRRDANECQFEALLLSPPLHQLGFIRAAFPVAMFAQDLRRFVALVRDLASAFPFFFGYAGFSFSESLDVATKQRNEPLLLPVAMRFAGIEVEASRTTICCMDHIKGAAWLTLIDAALVERAGGKANLRAQLSEGVGLEDVSGGLLIQAGPAPALGDINADERLPLYREVHKALTPIRVTDHWRLADRAFNPDETRRWMARFDD